MDVVVTGSRETERRMLDVMSRCSEGFEYLLTSLVDKMTRDRDAADVIKKKITLLQRFQSALGDPTSITADIPGFRVPTGISPDPEGFRGGFTFDYQSDSGVTDYVHAKASDGRKFQQKEIYTFYEHKIDELKTDMQTINSTSSTDQLTLQQLRSKIDGNYQLSSTLIKDLKELLSRIVGNF